MYVIIKARQLLLFFLIVWPNGKYRRYSALQYNTTTYTYAQKRFQREFNLLGNEALVLDEKYMYMRCSHHIINMIVKDGMLQISENVEAIRNAMQYVRSSVPRQEII